MACNKDLQLEALRDEWLEARSKTAQLRLRLINYNQQLEDLKKENARLKQLASQDPPEWVELASAVSTLLWKATDCPPIVGNLLKAKKKLYLLFQNVLITLESFSSVEDVFASCESVQLVTSLAGFLANLCSMRQGVEIMLNNHHGRVLISRIMELLEPIAETDIQPGSEECLVAALLQIIYYVALHPAGFKLVNGNETFVSTLCERLKSPGASLKVPALQIILALLRQNQCPTYRMVREALPDDELVKVAEELDNVGVGLVGDILERYKELGSYFDCASPVQLNELIETTSNSENDCNPISEERVDGLIAHHPTSDEQKVDALIAQSKEVLSLLETIDSGTFVCSDDGDSEYQDAINCRRNCEGRYKDVYDCRRD